MAIRYSGNVELRIKLVRMRGWNGKVGPFYEVHVRAPKYTGEAVLSPREAGVSGKGEELRTSDAYDRVARAVLDLARDRHVRLIEDHAAREGGVRGLFGRWEILRVQQAPCPLEEKLETRRGLGRGSGHSSGRRSKSKRFPMTRRDA